MSVLGTIPLRQRVHDKDARYSDDRAERKCISEHIIVSPFDSASIRTNSIDVTLGRYLKRSVFNTREAYDYRKGNMSYKEWDLREGDVIISPKSFMLGIIAQWIRMPLNLTATIETRSSVGRFGLFAVNAGRIEAGWYGNLTVELFNAEEFPILLSENMPLGQLVFQEVIGAVAYDNFSDSKYQGDLLPEPSKLYLEINKG